MDKVTKEQRSYIMSKIKGKNTKPEKIVFKSLKLLGLSFKRHYKLLGNPDVVFPKERVVVFVDGDFWHGWNFKKREGSLPGYWVTKIKKNIRRDLRYRRQLRSEGWKVVRLWEHQIVKKPDGCVSRIKKVLENSDKGTNVIEQMV